MFVCVLELVCVWWHLAVCVWHDVDGVEGKRTATVSYCSILVTAMFTTHMCARDRSHRICANSSKIAASLYTSNTSGGSPVMPDQRAGQPGCKARSFCTLRLGAAHATPTRSTAHSTRTARSAVACCRLSPGNQSGSKQSEQVLGGRLARFLTETGRRRSV